MKFKPCCNCIFYDRTPEEIYAAKGVKPTLSPNLETLALVEVNEYYSYIHNTKKALIHFPLHISLVIFINFNNFLFDATHSAMLFFKYMTIA